MKKLVKILFASTLLLSLFACSPKGNDEVVKNKQEVQQFKKINLGYYPQSIIYEFDYWDLVPKFPTLEDDGVWTRYGEYYRYMEEMKWHYDLDCDSDGLYDYRIMYYIFDAYLDGTYSFNYFVFKYEPIEWDILEEKDGKAIAISHSVLDKGAYSSFYSNDRWYFVTSDLRKWLNEDFYNLAFSNSEKEKIITSLVKNDREQTCITDGETHVLTCEDTEDKVYALSYKEAITYYKNEVSRKAKATSYVVSNQYFTYRDEEDLSYYSWWLRGPAWNYGRPAQVMDLGYVTAEYFIDDENVGIRPVICIDLNN